MFVCLWGAVLLAAGLAPAGLGVVAGWRFVLRLDPASGGDMRTQIVTWAAPGGAARTGVVSWEGGRDVPLLHDDATGYVSRVTLGDAVLTAVGDLDLGQMIAAQQEGMKFRVS